MLMRVCDIAPTPRSGFGHLDVFMGMVRDVAAGIDARQLRSSVARVNASCARFRALMVCRAAISRLARGARMRRRGLRCARVRLFVAA